MSDPREDFAIPTEPEDLPRLAAARPLTLDRSKLADLELLLLGAYQPLATFCDEATTRSILGGGVLLDQKPFPAPILLPVDSATTVGELLALRSTEGVIFALLEVTETFTAPGNTSEAGKLVAAGNLALVRLPRHADFPELRATPSAARASLLPPGTAHAFFCDTLPTPADEQAIAAAGGTTLVFIPSPDAPPGDLRHFLRVKAIVATMRSIAGNRETRCIVVPEVPPALRALVAQNHGAAALIPPPSPVRVGGGTDSVATNTAITELRERILPPAHRRGVTIWLTGLSQAGKSTIAAILTRHLLDYGRGSTLLDGDVVRTHLSKGLGFSREDRELNVRRVGFVAAEITRHGGTVVVAAIAPYRAIREENKRRIGDYVEVFVNAPVEVCEKRDQKGQYARARRGEILGFTGVDDPYEPPQGDPGTFVECRTDSETPEQSAEKIVQHLLTLSYLRAVDRID